MNIGIKYCGGCQSKYNRADIVKKIKLNFNEYKFEYVSENKKYDYIIIINGCHVKCADVSMYKPKKGFIWIDSSDYSILSKYL